MKAVTVAGGSSDDPEIEAETTVRKADREATAPAGALASADPEAEVAPEAEAGDTVRPEADAGPEAEAEAGTRPEVEGAREAEAESRDEAEADTGAEDRPEAGLSAAAVPAAEHARVAVAKSRGEATGPKARPAAEPSSEAEFENEAESGDEARAQAEAAPEPGVDDARATEAETGGEAELKDEAHSETQPAAKAAPDAGTKSQVEPGQSGTGDAHEAKAELRAGRTEGERGAETQADAAAPKDQAGPRTGVERAHETGPEPRGEAGLENEASPDAEAEAVPGAGTTAQARPRPSLEQEAEADGAAPSRVDGRPVVTAGDEARPEAEKRPGGKGAHTSEPEPRGEAEPEDEAHPDAEAEAAPTTPKAKADPRAGAAREAQAELGTGRTEGEPETETGPDAAGPKTQTRPGAGAAREAKAGLGTGRTKGEPETETGPDATAPKAQTRPGAGAAREPKAGLGTGRTGGEPEAKTGPDAAAPKAQAGPRTDAGPKAQTRSGAGAGDPREPKAGRPEAEAGPDAGAKDKPGQSGGKGQGGGDETQVIARPGPSWAREVERDAERTSQFVALKDLDTPAPAPAPVAARPAPPASTATAEPQPPLELLADLTNTPSPAETPRRTALRRVKIWTPILLLLVGAGAGAQLLRPLPAPQLVAAEADRTVAGQFSIPWPAKGQGAVRVSGSGDVGTFGEQKPVPTASVAKVMTAYVILKNHPLRKTEPGPDITIDAKTVADGTAEHESRIPGLTAGTKFSQQDMLKMLMIPSGNNVARMLARWDSGTDSEAAFVEKMNAAAKELGMTSTTYTDPSGLDARTVSTAADQLKLAEAVMKDETFRSIVALPNATIKGLSQRLENNNTLLTAQGLSIRGIKTGSSTPAGGTLMWAAYKSIGDETPLILGTLMDQHVDGPDEDGGNSLKLVLANSKTIIEAVRTALASVPVVRKGDVVGHVDDGLGGRTPLVAAKDLNVIGVPGQQLKLSLAPTAGAGPLPHTAKDGSEVAVLTVGSGEGSKSVPVAVKGALAEPSFGTRLTRGR
ncbi:serine hydrolase [Streptomyces avidinii]|uniref:serine hydrolase n=1 Tax=Streptomyces avidinii TaxID=1895 RepID=UPI00386E9D48|nr:serine hydrolase [Streptomyces avidinii]